MFRNNFGKKNSDVKKSPCMTRQRKHIKGEMKRAHTSSLKDDKEI